MKTVIKKHFVHIEEGGTVAPQPLGPAELVAEPSPLGPGIRVIELDGVVKAIEVTCSCGEVSVIELDPAQPTTAPDARSETNS
ncbi:MAG TPA: hypothetical protein ENJ09_14905 [Planctomycetes bacterium]|nr:hypothetical protein [Planctomycetota bacterium]